ncbi:GAF and ANTAR domain-containing protein [Dactylosporangium sp. McL0621]|uniref:GAF and ANTAR domain-containing protein n=1 Tax=Dactylosporangium sp. McL0621 TaxID=3415678 RepID=UPI003CF3A6AF
MVSVDRRMRLWSLAAAFAGGESVTVEHVCVAAASATGTDGAAIAVALRATPRETICSSNRVASEAEELSLTLGEGPCVEALAGGLALVADISTTHCLARWPVFAPAVVAAGVRAIFALPLQVGAIRLGVLDLYRAEPGELDQEQLLDALMLADTACALLLDGTGHDAPRLPGRVVEPAGLQYPEVHQATGMISVQLGLSAALALVRLRAYAYVNDRRLRDVAGDVVARRLRFDPEDTGGGGRSDGD